MPRMPEGFWKAFGTFLLMAVAAAAVVAFCMVMNVILAAFIGAWSMPVTMVSMVLTAAAVVAYQATHDAS